MIMLTRMPIARENGWGYLMQFELIIAKNSMQMKEKAATY